MYRVTLSIVFSLLALCVSFCHAQTSTKRIASGLDQPVFATHAPGDDSRLFVLEKDTGNIQILDLENEAVLDDPFLTVGGLRNGGERGLLGMAFHPDYSTNGKFYVYASMPGGTEHHRSHVFEYQVDGDPATSNVADANSRRNILQFSQPFGNHNGGWIGFDPTAGEEERSLLYVGTGDGGSGGDPRNNSQDITNNLLGKMLRIDIDGDAFPDSDTANYAIPASNPFVGVSGDDEIWAYGLRNPWRNSFDRQTGDIWIGDVGQGEIEEIDVLPSGTNGGQNYGWRIMEGTDCFRAGTIPCGDDSLVPPVYEYTHGSGPFQGNSVTGGYLYRGPTKEFQGHYLFADFGSDEIWSFNPYNQTVAERNDDLRADRGNVHSSIASFAEDNQGQLYVLGIGGSIYRLESSSRDARWVGDDANSGAVGDGTTFADANNWVRDGVVDSAFIDGDHLILGGADLTTPDPLPLSALTFESNTVLSSGQLQIASGNIEVAEGVSGTIAGRAFPASTTEMINKLGEGNLKLAVSSGRAAFAVVEGSVTVEQLGKYEINLLGDSVLDQTNTGEQLIETLTMSAESTFRTDTASNLNSTASAVLDGNLDVAMGIGIEFELPAEGERSEWTILESSDIQGQFRITRFNGEDFGHLGDGTFVSLSQTTESLSIRAYSAIPGDADGNGTVEFSDFLELSSSFGQEGDWLSGDFSGDGGVDFEDFLLLTENFSRTVGPVASVPEPTANGLCCLAAVSLMLRRTRRRS